MNERKLRIFYEVATNLSMTQVAKKLYISQPAISQTIKELETILNVKLFDRINKKLFLTYEGKVFLNYTRRILNLYDESLNKLKDINTLEDGKLKIGASTTIGIYILTDIIGKFTKQHKNIDVSITIENTKIISNMILENKIDFAYVEGPIYSNEIIIKDFLNDELVFIASPEHPWSKKENIDIKEVENEKLIMREKGSGTREIVKQTLEKNELNYSIYLELGNIEAIKRAVKANLGVSCISKRCIKEEVTNKNLCIIPLKNKKITRKLNIIHHNDKYLTKLFYGFMDFSKRESNQIT